ncbi:MAG TPA: low molecular weight protein arginine phosphatase, partial [Massilibacterium sp.]|nr:low molecular weight protein arginine phosphatase [Massilibacterium sp.]
SYYPHMKEKVFTLKEYANGERGNVNDPFGGSLSVYRDTLQEIEALVDQVIEKLQKRSDA